LKQGLRSFKWKKPGCSKRLKKPENKPIIYRKCMMIIMKSIGRNWSTDSAYKIKKTFKERRTERKGKEGRAQENIINI